MESARLENKVCVVTGGSSGIGKAIAMRFAREGGEVFVLARDEDELDSVVADIESGGGTAHRLVADVSRYDELEQAVRTVIDRTDRLDVVVANAGINGVWAPVEDLAIGDWQKTLDVNLNGTFFTLKAAAGALKRSRGAAIVMSSVNGTRMFSNVGASAYATSKAAQVALTKMIALEWADARVRVNAICPGGIATPIHEKTERVKLDEAAEPVVFPEGSIPLTDGRLGKPEQIAAVAVFLASDEASHVTGEVIFVDGGQSLLQG